MTSEHVSDLALRYCMRELSDAERRAVERHLAECARCRAEIDEISIGLAAVAQWPERPSLPEGVEDRLVRSLASVRAGVALGRHRPWWRSSVAAAVLLCLVSAAAGFETGRLTSRATRGTIAVTPTGATTDSTLRSYMLLLEEPVWPPAQRLSRDGYSAWAQAIRAEGRYVGAEKFSEEPGLRVSGSGVATRPRPAEPNFSGWYIVRARSYDEAVAWARRGPHLAYGTVLVREIEP